MKNKVILLLLGTVMYLASCKKDRSTDPLKGDWRTAEIYTKFSYPGIDLTEKTIDTKKFLAEKGYFPGYYTHIGFYALDSMYIKFQESIDENTSFFLYKDPDKNSSSIKIDRLKGTYTIVSDTIIMKYKFGNYAPQEIRWRYELNGNKLNIIIRDKSREISNNQYYDKEVYRLVKE